MQTHCGNETTYLPALLGGSLIRLNVLRLALRLLNRISNEVSRVMKALFFACFCVVSIALSAQTTLQTFTSPDGVFQFKHSKVLVRCTEQKHEEGYPGLWAPQESCESYDPVCDDPGSEGSTTLVCFAFPKAEFKDYPSFDAATFSVAEIREAITEYECLSGNPDWVIDPRGSGTTTRINHVKFKVFDTDGVGSGHSLDGHVYRNFHRNTCYELSIRTAATNPRMFEGPAKEFTEKNWKEVSSKLKQSLDSFQFLK